MNSEESQNTDRSSNILPTTESHVIQALPRVFAAPLGWHSELVRSPVLVPTESESYLIDSYTSSLNKHEANTTLNTPSASLMTFSSTNDPNHMFNQLSSSTILPTTTTTTATASVNSSGVEVSNALMAKCSSQKQKSILIEDQQSSKANSENEQSLPLILQQTLPNHTITYQQNISVRYLQPPTPPSPGPLIIRKENNICIKLFDSFYLLGEVRPERTSPQTPIKV